MAKKDPAVLFYIATWLTATAEMDSDVRGWYLNLLLHQYDKKDLPVDIEKLALLAGVKFSEFERFKQMYEQVLKQKFKQNAGGRLENESASEIIRSREEFKDKRERSGNIGVVIKTAKTIVGFNHKKAIYWLKERLYSATDEEIEQAKDKQVLMQMLNLYRNKNENTNEVKVIEKGDANLVLNEVQKYQDAFDADYKIDEMVVSENGFTKENLVQSRAEFWNTKKLDAEMLNKPYSDVQVHFLRWCRQNKDRIKSSKGGPPKDKGLGDEENFKESRTAL